MQDGNRYSRGGKTAALLLSATMAAACSSSPPPSTGSDLNGDAALELHPGDAVALEVWRAEDMTDTFEVDDRGIVTLPLLGERKVTGMGPSELRAELLEDYRKYLQNPAIEVTVLRRISILGAVNEPGLYPVDATVSLSDALALAGGIAPNGDPEEIRLVRGDSVMRRELNRAMLVGRSDIRSGDRIVVGEKGWLARNPAALIGSLIAAGTVILVNVIR